MNQENIINGENEQEIWQKIKDQFEKDPEPLEYRAVINHDGKQTVLDIDIDLGGGFESGYETTTLTSHLHGAPSFKFAIHDEHFTDEIGKFFGMQDVEIGYQEFDKKVIVKTDDETRAREIFSRPEVRSVFQSLSNFSFGIHNHHSSHPERDGHFLEFYTETGITDPQQLQELYHAFFAVLAQLDEKVTI